MLSALLVVLTLALDPLGEPHALKRALLLVIAPFLLFYSWQFGRLRRVANAPLGMALGLGFLALGIQIAASVLHGSVERGFDSLATMFLLLIAAVVARDSASERPYAFTSTALVLGGLAATYAILQRIGIDPLFDNPGREAVSLFGNTNRAGEFLAPMIPLALASLRSLRSALRRLGAIVLPLAVGATILTNSRGAVIAAAVGVVALLVLRRPRLQELAILALGVALPFLVDGLDSYRLKTVEESESAISSPEYAPNKQRLALVESTLAMIRSAPAIGHGAGSFRSEFGFFRDPDEARLPTALGVLSSAEDPHNQYLLLAAEYGIPGAAMILAVLLAGLLSVRHARVWPGDHPLRDVAAGSAAALITLLALGAFRSFLEHAPVALLAFGFAGTLLSLQEGDHDGEPRPIATFVLPLWLIAVFLIGARALYSQFYIGVAARAIERKDVSAAEDAYRQGRRFGAFDLVLMQREAALLEQHSKIDTKNPWLRLAALDSRRQLAQLDPWNATNHLRLAARFLENGDRSNAAQHLATVSKILGERDPWSLARRLAESGEFDSGVRYLVDSARARRITLSELRALAERQQADGKNTLALLALMPCVELRPEDGDIALAVGGLLPERHARKNEFLRRGHTGIALAALIRRDTTSALKSLQLAKRFGSGFELQVAFTIAATLEGGPQDLKPLLATRPAEGPAPWLAPMLDPLRSLPELASTFEQLDSPP